jgi:hypothetical protein
VITLAVSWYLRHGLSRDVEELLAEQGITVDHVSVAGGCSGSPVGAEPVIHGGDLWHRWTVNRQHDHRPWRRLLYLIFRQLVAWLE